MSHVLRISLVAVLLAGVGALLTPRRVLRAAVEKLKALSRWLGAPAPRNRATAFAIIWIVALIPMLHLTWLVRHYAVEVPTLDDWEMAPLIVDFHNGHLKWADLFAQQQEGRTILPKLIFILSSVSGHWDVRDQMMLSVVCCWLTAIGIFILLRRSNLGRGAIAICFWLAMLAIFSTAQFELWIFASGFPSFFPALFLVAGLVVVGSDRLPTTAKFVLCGAVATASSFSLPHGLLVWGLTFPVLIATRTIPRWRLWTMAWIGLTAVCAGFYFAGYQKPPDLPAFAPTVSWLDYVGFILEFLGGSLAYAAKSWPALAATIFGAIQLILLIVAVFFCIRRIRDRAFVGSALPWFALGLYSIGSAVLAALGRVAYGANYALASRYVTFSLYLFVAVAVLTALIFTQTSGARRTVSSRAWSYAICLVLLGLYLVPYKVCAFNTRFFLRAWSAKDRLARGAVLFSPAIDTSEIIKKTAYPNDARPVTVGVDALDRLHLVRPPLIRTNRLDAIAHEVADGKQASGVCESVVIDGELVRASGWAVLDGKGRPPDCVAVAYQASSDQSWTLCAISDSFAMRPEIVKRLRTIEQLWSGWSATFSTSAFPPGARLSFWAVDADEARLYQLKDGSAATR